LTKEHFYDCIYCTTKRGGWLEETFKIPSIRA